MKSFFWERDWIFGRMQTITFERRCGSFNIPYCICCSSVTVASPILHLCLSTLYSFDTLFNLFIFCSSPPATLASHLCSSSCTNGEVTIIHVYWWCSLNRCETGAVVDIAFLFMLFFGFCFMVPLFTVLSFLLWKFLWLNEELLTLLCFFLIVRGDFSILMRDIILQMGILTSSAITRETLS